MCNEIQLEILLSQFSQTNCLFNMIKFKGITKRNIVATYTLMLDLLRWKEVKKNILQNLTFKQTVMTLSCQLSIYTALIHFSISSNHVTSSQAPQVIYLIFSSNIVSAIRISLYYECIQPNFFCLSILRLVSWLCSHWGVGTKEVLCVHTHYNLHDMHIILKCVSVHHLADSVKIK